jgi:hypothetical protein
VAQFTSTPVLTCARSKEAAVPNEAGTVLICSDRRDDAEFPCAAEQLCVDKCGETIAVGPITDSDWRAELLWAKSDFSNSPSESSTKWWLTSARRTSVRTHR